MLKVITMIHLNKLYCINCLKTNFLSYLIKMQSYGRKLLKKQKKLLNPNVKLILENLMEMKVKLKLVALKVKKNQNPENTIKIKPLILQ